jgi:small membrane protein
MILDLLCIDNYGQVIMMEITIIQVVIILFALFAWSRAMLRLRDSNISIGEFSFWSLIWSVVIIVAIFPDLISNLSTIVGIGRGVDLALYASIILLFYLTFRLYVKIDAQSKETTKLVREIAIRDAKKKK